LIGQSGVTIWAAWVGGSASFAALKQATPSLHFSTTITRAAGEANPALLSQELIAIGATAAPHRTQEVG
jgi:uncharacterized membrane protein